MLFGSLISLDLFLALLSDVLCAVWFITPSLDSLLVRLSDVLRAVWFVIGTFAGFVTGATQ